MADYNNRSGRRQGGKNDFSRRDSFNKNGRNDGERARGRSYGDKPYGDRSYGEKRFSGKPNFDHPRGDRPYGERKFGERPFSGKPNFDKPRGDRTYGERNFGERGERPFSGKPNFDRPRGDRPYGERNFGERGDRPFSGKPNFDRPRGDRPFGDKPREGRPFDERRRFDEGRGAKHGPVFEEPAAETKPEELPNIIMGRNPVKEAIKSGRSIDRILVTKEHDGSLGEILGLAKDRSLIIREVDRRKLDEICMPFGHDGKTGNHQGIVAEIPGVEYSELSEILAYAEEKGEKPFIILLDGIEDPHNLGSIIRSAECAGAHGVVIPKRRSAPVTAAVVKTSAGAAEHMRIARVVNIVSAMEQLKSAGLWIAGADMGGESMYKVDMKGAFALVIGGEGDGLSKLVREKCDYLVSIPLKGSIDSLNAAVASAILMFEKNRQDAE